MLVEEVLEEYYLAQKVVYLLELMLLLLVVGVLILVVQYILVLNLSEEMEIIQLH